jgi:hypothetical protein
VADGATINSGKRGRQRLKSAPATRRTASRRKSQLGAHAPAPDKPADKADAAAPHDAPDTSSDAKPAEHKAAPQSWSIRLGFVTSDGARPRAAMQTLTMSKLYRCANGAILYIAPLHGKSGLRPACDLAKSAKSKPSAGTGKSDRDQSAKLSFWFWASVATSETP